MPDMADSSLAVSVATLAGTPDDASDVDARLGEIAQLAVDRISAVDYTSITALGDDGYLTVAVSSDLIRAVDDVQYELGGPCVQALKEQAPTGALSGFGEPAGSGEFDGSEEFEGSGPLSDNRMRWPGFVDAAARLGLTRTVSLPLFTGSGAAAAVLNLYGRDEAALAPLAAGIWIVYAGKPPSWYSGPLESVDAGARELVVGFAGAVAVRATIQHALSLITDRYDSSAVQAYHWLRTHADRTGHTLTEAAEALIKASR